MSTKPEIVVQADVGGGLNIAFTIPSDLTEIDETLDRTTRAIARQKAKLDLAQQLLALQANEKMLEMLPQRAESETKARAEERMRMRSQYESEHFARGRRGEFKMTAAQTGSLEQFDKQSEQMRDRLAKERRDLERDRPIIEAQISRLRAIIAGRDPTEYVIQEGAATAA